MKPEVQVDLKTIKQGLSGYMETLGQTLTAVDAGQLAQVTEVLYKAFREEKQIFTMGNGGHANTAAHMINDIAKHTTSSDSKNTFVCDKRFRTMCLNDSISFVTGIANDVGFDQIFSEQLNNWCNPGDVVIGISGSGNSPNVLNAFKVAKERGATSICFSGKGGGKAKEAADICIVVPSGKMVQIEDVHLAINHAVADELKKLVQNRTDIAG